MRAGWVAFPLRVLHFAGRTSVDTTHDFGSVTEARGHKVMVCVYGSYTVPLATGGGGACNARVSGGPVDTTHDFGSLPIEGAQAKNCSGTENRDASILVGKHIANAMTFATVFRSFSSTATYRSIGIGRFGVEKTTFDSLKKT